MVKANKKLILKIVLLVLVLVATVVGLVYFVNWRETENYVTCVIALQDIDENTEILTSNVDTYFKEVKQVIPESQKDRTPITINKLKEETYYTLKEINVGDVIFENYDVSRTASVVNGNENRIEIPLSVNLANVSGGQLNWNEQVMIYAYGNLRDNNGNTEWRSVLASDNALVKKITTGSDGSSQYYTFEVDKSDVATIYYLSSVCSLYFLPMSVGNISEESATEIIQSLIGIENTNDGSITVYEPYSASILETNMNEPEVDKIETTYNLEVITNKDGEADKGFNLKWAKFKPESVTIRHTSLKTDVTDFDSWEGVYTVNNSDLDRRITFDKATGLYEFARQDLPDYAFGEEGYYEISLDGSKVTNRTLEDGTIIQERTPVTHKFRFLIVDELDLTPHYDFVPTLESSIINDKFNVHYNSDYTELLHKDEIRFTPSAFINNEKEELYALRNLDFKDLSKELEYKKSYVTVSKPNGGVDAVQTINVAREFASDMFPDFVQNYEGTISEQKIKDFAKYVVYILGGTIDYTDDSASIVSLVNTALDKNMYSFLNEILNGEVSEGNSLYNALKGLTTSEYQTLLADLLGNPSFVYVPSTADSLEGDNNIKTAVFTNTNLDPETNTYPGRNGTLNFDLCNIFLGELTKKSSDKLSTLTNDTNIKLTNLVNYNVANDYLAVDLYFQNYDSYSEDNSFYKIALQGKEQGNSRLNVAVDGLN